MCFSCFTDIQEFYECTLLDDSKSTQQKTLETLRIASKWEQEPPITSTQPKFEVRIIDKIIIDTINYHEKYKDLQQRFEAIAAPLIFEVFAAPLIFEAIAAPLIFEVFAAPLIFEAFSRSSNI